MGAPGLVNSIRLISRLFIAFVRRQNDGLSTEEHLSRDGLSKRLRETLTLLLEGYSEKQVACELRLAPRTVHDYVAMLYQHLRVSSRAELLAYFIRRKPIMRPLELPEEQATNTTPRS